MHMVHRQAKHSYSENKLFKKFTFNYLIKMTGKKKVSKQKNYTKGKIVQHILLKNVPTGAWGVPQRLA